MRPINYSSPLRQKGMSKWGWLLVIIAIISTVTTALRIGPHYIDFKIVQGVLANLSERDVHKNMSRRQIEDHFKKQFRIESFRLSPKEVMKVNRDREETIINIDYEIREHLFYNVDVVLAFSDQRSFH